MPLNLSVGDADFIPYLKYNAKAGRFYAKADGGTEEIEIINPVLAIDMANIKTGWLYYAEGTGPEKIWDPSPSQAAPKPRDQRKFKRGFEVMVFGNGVIPHTTQKLGLREMSSTAANVISAILRMHADYEAGVAANRDCVPIYACDGVKPITGAYGVNYEPLFTLKGWVPRSRVPAFDEHASTVAATAPATKNGHYDERNPPPVDNFGLAPAPNDQQLNDDIPF